MQDLSKTNDFNLFMYIEMAFVNNITGSRDLKKLNSSYMDGLILEKYISFFEENLKENDTLIFALSRERLFGKGAANNVLIGNLPRTASIENVKKIERGLMKFVKVIKNKGANLILVDAIPKTCHCFNHPSIKKINFKRDILRKGKVSLCDTYKNISIEDRVSLTEIYKKLSNDNKDITYLDFHDDLCKESICSIVDDDSGKILYSDFFGHSAFNFPLSLSEKFSNLLK